MNPFGQFIGNSVPRTEWVFARVPGWLKTANVGVFALTSAGAGAGAAVAQRLWRYIGVKKLGWMTDKELDEFWKRDPGF